jgi:hypothetical protein
MIWVSYKLKLFAYRKVAAELEQILDTAQSEAHIGVESGLTLVVDFDAVKLIFVGGGHVLLKFLQIAIESFQELEDAEPRGTCLQLGQTLADVDSDLGGHHHLLNGLVGRVH